MVMRVEPDYLTRAVVKTPAIRLAIGSFKDLTSEGLIRHDTDPVAGRLLAGALSSAALMSVLLDDKEKYSIRIDYPGPYMPSEPHGEGDIAVELWKKLEPGEK